MIRYHLAWFKSNPTKLLKSKCSSDQKYFFLLQVTCLLTALQRAQARPPTRSPSSNFFSLPFEKTAQVSKKKKERNKTTWRTKMPGGTLLSFAHPLCLGTLSFAEGKIEYPSDLTRSLFFSFASYLLACCLADGASATADGAEGGGGVAALIARSARPNPWQQYSCNFHQKVLAQLSLALEKARKSVLREMSIRTLLSRNWKKAIKWVLRELPSSTFLLGNWKNSGWTIIGPWTTIVEWTATAYRNSSLLLQYDCPL